MAERNKSFVLQGNAVFEAGRLLKGELVCTNNLTVHQKDKKPTWKDPLAAEVFIHYNLGEDILRNIGTSRKEGGVEDHSVDTKKIRGN